MYDTLQQWVWEYTHKSLEKQKFILGAVIFVN